MKTREIRFRAWNGKFMVLPQYGDWVSFDGVPYTQKYNTPNIEIEKAKDYILMQSTGLKDKNGKDIYEGDIIRFDDRVASVGEVVYDSGSFKSQMPAFGIYWKLNHKNTSKKNRVEVIGSVFENPELLEKRN